MSRKLLSVIAAFSMFLSCCVSSTEDTVGSRTVKVLLKQGSGTGVVLSISERGSFILTAGHVVVLGNIETETGKEKVGTAITDEIFVLTSDGKKIRVYFLTGGVKPVDYAILWTFEDLGTLSSEEVVRDCVPDELLSVEYFSPQDSPGIYHGSCLAEGLMDITPPAKVEFGNSGSGIYDSEGKLLGIIVARGPEGEIGIFHTLLDMSKDLEDRDLGWLLR